MEMWRTALLTERRHGEDLQEEEHSQKCHVARAKDIIARMEKCLVEACWRCGCLRVMKVIEGFLEQQ